MAKKLQKQPTAVQAPRAAFAFIWLFVMVSVFFMMYYSTYKVTHNLVPGFEPVVGWDL